MPGPKNRRSKVHCQTLLGLKNNGCAIKGFVVCITFGNIIVFFIDRVNTDRLTINYKVDAH